MSTINGIDSAASLGASGPLASVTSKQDGLGKDAFMKLLVAQIQHQDPLKPMDDTAFVGQLAQFSGLEQQMSTNKLLTLVASQQQGLSNSAAVGLVGKSITANGSKVTLDANTVGAPVRFTLDAAASKVDVTIKDQSGRTVRTIHMGPTAGGPVMLQWDGRDDGGTSQPPGAYSVSLAASDASGTSIPTAQQMTGVVTGVSYAAGYASLMLDNGSSVPVSELLQVNK